MYSVVVSLLWYKEDMSQRGISSKCYILRLFQFFLYVICILTFSQVFIFGVQNQVKDFSISFLANQCKLRIGYVLSMF